MLHIKTFEFNMLPVNTYVVWDETKEAVVIDCGCYYEAEKQEFIQFIQENGLSIVRLIDTHLHFDHIFGNPFMWHTFGIKAEAHKADLPWLDQVTERIRAFGIRECDTPVPLGGYLMKVMSSSSGTIRLRFFMCRGIPWGRCVSIARKKMSCSQAMLCSASV